MRMAEKSAPIFHSPFHMSAPTAYAHQCDFHFDLVQLKSFFFFVRHLTLSIFPHLTHARALAQTADEHSLARHYPTMERGTNSQNFDWIFFTWEAFKLRVFLLILHEWKSTLLSLILLSSNPVDCARSREIYLRHSHTPKWFFIRFWILIGRHFAVDVKLSKTTWNILFHLCDVRAVSNAHPHPKLFVSHTSHPMPKGKRRAHIRKWKIILNLNGNLFE